MGGFPFFFHLFWWANTARLCTAFALQVQGFLICVLRQNLERDLAERTFWHEESPRLGTGHSHPEFRA